MRIDSNSLNIQPTDDPAIVVISGRATDDPETVTNDLKTWYPFEIRWNTNQAAKEFGSKVAALVETKKPKAEIATLKSTLVKANKTIVDMTGEEPIQEGTS